MSEAEEWAWFMARLHADGEHGVDCCDVIRRYVAGEIEDRHPVRFLPDDTRMMFDRAEWGEAAAP